MTSRPIMRKIVSRRRVDTETGFFYIETLSCKHIHYAFPADTEGMKAKSRSCHECLRYARAGAHWLGRLIGRKPPKAESKQCRRCDKPARWPYKLCKKHLREFRAARSRRRMS
jgi:hypothetical protein